MFLWIVITSPWIDTISEDGLLSFLANQTRRCPSRVLQILGVFMHPELRTWRTRAVRSIEVGNPKELFTVLSCESEIRDQYAFGNLGYPRYPILLGALPVWLEAVQVVGGWVHIQNADRYGRHYQTPDKKRARNDCWIWLRIVRTTLGCVLEAVIQMGMAGGKVEQSIMMVIISKWASE